MSVTLAKNEKIIRSYDYAGVKSHSVLDGAASYRNLTITNRRIIQSNHFKGTGKEGLQVSEMPVSSAQYVDVAHKVLRYPIFLVLGILFALIAIFTAISAEEVSSGTVMTAIFSIVCFIIYALKKDCVLLCSIAAEKYVTPVMMLRTSSGNSLTRHVYRKAAGVAAATTINVAVKVDTEVAKQMTEELGAVILAAANGEYND